MEDSVDFHERVAPSDHDLFCVLVGPLGIHTGVVIGGFSVKTRCGFPIARRIVPGGGIALIKYPEARYAGSTTQEKAGSSATSHVARSTTAHKITRTTMFEVEAFKGNEHVLIDAYGRLSATMVLRQTRRSNRRRTRASLIDRPHEQRAIKSEYQTTPDSQPFRRHQAR